MCFQVALKSNLKQNNKKIFLFTLNSYTKTSWTSEASRYHQWETGSFPGVFLGSRMKPKMKGSTALLWKRKVSAS